MTKEAELLLQSDLEHEDYMEAQLDNISDLDEAVDTMCGIDPETGEMDPDSGLLFPQPIQEM